MAKVSFICCTIAALSFLGPAVAIAEWSTYQGNAAHTGYVPGTLDLSNVSLLWKSNSRASGLAVGGGAVFANSLQQINAFDEATGATLWNHSFIVGNLYPPAYANGHL